jgi:hypothetical protein
MESLVQNVGHLDGTPPVVHISDIHGYFQTAISALTALGEAQDDPVVVTDEDGMPHWAGNDYVLIFNGDLIDRGPDNQKCLEMVWRLQDEAPSGRVHYHLGNHEMAILLPEVIGWRDTFSIEMSQSDRQDFLTRILDGEVTIAFKGYTYTYSHAGSNNTIHPAEANALLRKAVNTLLEHADASHQYGLQSRVARRHQPLFELGENGGRGPSAGICWLDFQYLNPSAPPQVVGHTPHNRPLRTGNVVCGDVIRINHTSPGGEGVLIETADQLRFVGRSPDGGITSYTV